jgi:hypothetical protein
MKGDRMTKERSQYDEQTLGIEDGPGEVPADGRPVAPGEDIEGLRPGDVGLTPGSLADNVDMQSEVSEDRPDPSDPGPAG